MTLLTDDFEDSSDSDDSSDIAFAAPSIDSEDSSDFAFAAHSHDYALIAVTLLPLRRHGRW